MEPSETDYAYLAGIIDGEGHLGQYGTRSPVLEVAMCDMPTIEWLRDTFGGCIFTPAVPKPNARQYWKWNLSVGDMRVHLPRVLPHAKTKRLHIRIVIELMEIRGLRLGNKRNNPGRQEELCRKLKSLNRQGNTPSPTVSNVPSEKSEPTSPV